MKHKLCRATKEQGIYIGNQVDKSQLKNPLSRALVARFDRRVLAATGEINPESILEVGCGEGRLVTLISSNFPVRVLATDFSVHLIDKLASENRNPRVEYRQSSAYDLIPSQHQREMVICCEVLEHLEKPSLALKKMKTLQAGAYLFSVPWEPIWRILNIARGSYLKQLGNTPGHLNHWSRRSFEKCLLEAGYSIDRTFNPFPWTMVLAR